MTKVMSEDDIRKAGKRLSLPAQPAPADPAAKAVVGSAKTPVAKTSEPHPETVAWQPKHLRQSYEPLLYEPWVLDIDTTIKTAYGHQEGAQVGYHPHKPGRPMRITPI